MENPQGTSFIPQRPTRGKTAPRKVRKIYVLAYLSIVLFFGSLLAAAGVFFFNLSLDIQLEKQEKFMAQERQQFNQGDIESVRDLEERITIAQERLDNHVSVLSIFEALEASAVQSISFVSFTYKRLGDGFPQVAFTGVSDQFNNILFQREVLASNPILAGSLFKEVSLTSLTGTNNTATGQKVIAFELGKEIDTGLIGYTPRSGGGVDLSEGVEDQEEILSEDQIFTETENSGQDVPEEGTNEQTQ
jgi:hypothetical protein